MPKYQVDIVTPGRKQTFITEDLDSDEVIKTRLKSFVDFALGLRDFDIDIRVSNGKGQKADNGLMQVKCLWDPEQLCPLRNDQSIDACLHCDGRGDNVF